MVQRSNTARSAGTVEIQRVVDAQPMRFPVQYVTARISIFVVTPERWHPVAWSRATCKSAALWCGIKRRADRTFDGDREEAFAGEAITLVLRMRSISAVVICCWRQTKRYQCAERVGGCGMDGGTAAFPGPSYDIKIAGKKTRARVDGIRFRLILITLPNAKLKTCR